jgi:hypothetical protein
MMPWLPGDARAAYGSEQPGYDTYLSRCHSPLVEQQQQSNNECVADRHRDGRNTLMPLFSSVSPVRAASQPEPLTARALI